MHGNGNNQFQGNNNFVALRDIKDPPNQEKAVHGTSWVDGIMSY